MADLVFSHILVLADGSEQSSHAAGAAITLAKACQARLTALAVVDTETLRHLLTHRILTAQEMIDFEIDLEANAHHHLEQVKAAAAQHGVTAEQVLLRGSWNTAALAQQKELAADLVVLAGFKSSRISRDLLAREYQMIIDECPCPILLVK
jgi:nucleotide-binding universal stress UspA family protein